MVKRSKKKNNAMVRLVPRPLAFDSNPELSFTFRFSATTGNSFSIKRSDLLSRLAMSSSTTAGQRLFCAVKLRRVRIWGETPAPAGSTDVSLQWISENGPPKLIQDYSNSPTFPPYIDAAPPSMSLAGFWSISGFDESDVIFACSMGPGAIIEIDTTCVLSCTGLLSTTQTGSTTLAITASGGGIIGAPALDHSGSDQLVAQFWPNFA